MHTGVARRIDAWFTAKCIDHKARIVCREARRRHGRLRLDDCVLRKGGARFFRVLEIPELRKSYERHFRKRAPQDFLDLDELMRIPRGNDHRPRRIERSRINLF